MSCVLTLALDDISQERFEAERQRWFPAALNRVPAHLSLFHTLPESEQTVTTLREAAANQSGFQIEFAELRTIGRGVAYFSHSPDLAGLHRGLSSAFAEHLSAQDRQGFRPHVVVQNKAGRAEVAEALLSLRAAFRPFTAFAVGLDLWRYLGGPWQHLQRLPFTLAE